MNGITTAETIQDMLTTREVREIGFVGRVEKCRTVGRMRRAGIAVIVGEGGWWMCIGLDRYGTLEHDGVQRVKYLGLEVETGEL